MKTLALSQFKRGKFLASCKSRTKQTFFLICIENSQILAQRKFDLVEKLPTINITGKS